MHEFPLVLKHRSNPHASIVVMNADQLNSVPDEFAPDEVRKAHTEGGANVGFTPAEKQISADGGAQRSEDLDKREKALEKAFDEFSEDVRQQSKKLQEDRDGIERERAELDQLRTSLEQQSQDLQRERAEFEAQRNDAANGALKQGESTNAGGTVQANAEGEAKPADSNKRKSKD